MSNIKNKLESFINDITSIEVATFTSSSLTSPSSGAPATPTGDGTDDKNSINALFTAIRENLKDRPLVGYVRVDLDGDTVAFLDENASDSLQKYHLEMVKEAKAARKDLVDGLISLVK